MTTVKKLFDETKVLSTLRAKYRLLPSILLLVVIHASVHYWMDGVTRHQG